MLFRRARRVLDAVRQNRGEMGLLEQQGTLFCDDGGLVGKKREMTTTAAGGSVGCRAECGSTQLNSTGNKP